MYTCIYTGAARRSELYQPRVKLEKQDATGPNKAHLLEEAAKGLLAHVVAEPADEDLEARAGSVVHRAVLG